MNCLFSKFFALPLTGTFKNPIVIPVLQRGRADILQQDNARYCVARHTMFSSFTAE